MKHVVSIAQRQPGFIAIADADIRRTATHYGRCRGPTQEIIGVAKLKHTCRGLQAALIIDQVAAGNAAWQIAHEYYGQTHVDFRLQTRANVFITACAVLVFVTQPDDYAGISPDKRLYRQ